MAWYSRTVVSVNNNNVRQQFCETTRPRTMLTTRQPASEGRARKASRVMTSCVWTAGSPTRPTLTLKSSLSLTLTLSSAALDARALPACCCFIYI